MKAIHLVRGRQEERELAYWLSLVSYDRRDVSFQNRLYMLYLIVFLGFVVFATLIYFAGGIAPFLLLINPGDPQRAAAFLEIAILGAWGLFGLWQSVRRSPVVFSEADASLICQMPVNHRLVTLRWLGMPWLKIALPFWVAAITLGLAIAEIRLGPGLGVKDLYAYSGYGLRAWAAIVPVHLGLFVLQWVVGVLRLQKEHKRNWLAWPVMLGALAGTYGLLVLAFDGGRAAGLPWLSACEGLLYPIQAGFGGGSLWAGVLAGGVLAAFLFGLLVWAAGSFSLQQAAQETQEIEKVQTALQYGFFGVVQTTQTQQRLGIARAPSRLPGLGGGAALLWKDMLQTRRTLGLGWFGNWLSIFSLMLGMAFIPNLGLRLLAVFLWVMQVGRVVQPRLRNDLSRWALLRQLPVSGRMFILYDLGLACFLTLAASLAGLGVGALLLRTSLGMLALLLPGMIAGVAGMTAFDIIRRSRNDLLLNESVPELGTTGLLLGALCGLAPVLMPGLLGVAVSLGLGALGVALAVSGYEGIGR